MSERRRISSGGPWEAVAGYSRAIAVGDSCWVAGTTDAGPDGISRHPGDAGAQTRAVLGIIEAALGEAGFALADVVRTRRSGLRPRWSRSAPSWIRVCSSRSRRRRGGAECPDAAPLMPPD